MKDVMEEWKGLLNNDFNRFPDFIVGHVFSPDGIADIELGANGADEAPVKFGVTGAILLQRIELLACVLVDVVG